jgi:CubicO group peptidase (beta-lactamase class C family)
MANLYRREVLGGIAAVAVGSSWSRAQSTAVIKTEPPAEGPLSAGAVASLLAQNKVPGASLAVVQNGAIVATYGYGTAQPNRPVTPRTRFQAASISKTINALAVLKYAEADEIQLDDPVNRRLKSWKLPDNALTTATPVTIRMLLNHTGGTSTSGFEGYRPGAPLPTLVEVLNGSPPANSAPVRVEWPPGKTFHYSGGGSIVLQQMMIDVSLGKYPAVVDHVVFELLEMRDSNFDQLPNAAELARCAFGYGDDGAPLPGGFMVHPESAAAGLWTTASDLALMVIGIIQSHAGKPGAFLAQRLATEMLKPGLNRAGLGTFIDDKGMFWHNGGNIGFRALYVGDPATGNGMAALTNGNAGEKVYVALRDRVAATYGWR